MIKRLFLIVTILFTVITTAQEGTSSPYSFYGIGLNAFKGTAENRAMGGLSIYSDSIHLNLQNPAALGRLRLTTYTVGASHSAISLQTSDAEESSNITTLDYLAVGLPAGRFGFSFGLVPYSSVGYNLTNVDETAETAARFSGTGGLNRVFLSAGYEISNSLSIGANVDYNFGNIENKNIFIREGLQYGSREMNRTELSGLTFSLGLNYDQMLNDKLELKAAAVYIPARDLSARNTRELSTVTFSNLGQEIVTDNLSIPVNDSEYSLASQYSAGLGIGQPRKWFLGGEYVTTEASDFSNLSYSREGASYTSASKYKVGGFYIPNYNSLTSYFSRIVYRGGLRMEETGLELNEEAINEFGISFGVGLPAGRMFSNANLGFEYGQRGTTNAGLVQENFWNVFISLSLNDRWFVQRRFE